MPTCPVCRAQLQNPGSASHQNSRRHQEALEGGGGYEDNMGYGMPQRGYGRRRRQPPYEEYEDDDESEGGSEEESEGDEEEDY